MEEDQATTSVWPRVDLIDENSSDDKKKELCMQCINYALSSHLSSSRNHRLATMNRMYNSYNGVVDTKAISYLNKTYGKQNVTKYIDYRLGKTKIDVQIGEFLLQKLKTTIYNINPEARSRFQEQFNLNVGMKMAGPEINKLRNVVGADILGGMPIPQGTDDEIWDRLNAKQKNQLIMQILVNRHIEMEDMKSKFSSNYLDLFITSECHGKTYIDKAGYVRYREIDPRDALFEEIDRDNYILRSPYMGERRWMYVTDVLDEWPELAEEDKKKIYEYATSPDVNNIAEGNRNAYKKLHGKLYLLTGTIEFFAFQTRHFVKNDSGTREISSAEFEKNKPKIEAAVRRGDYRFETKYKKTLWEVSKIGANTYTRYGPKSNIIGSIANPFETLSSYTGLLLNTKDGVRVSLQETLDPIGDVFNVALFQLRRELAKAKGKVLPYDKAGLPKGQTMKGIIHQAINDGIVEFSSAADGLAGNISGEKLNNIAGFLKEIDLGISSTVPVLLQIWKEMKMIADQLTGVNENREGDIKASQTATNSNNAIAASRTMTLPIYYFFGRYMENVMLRVAEYGKIAYGILNPELGETLLGAAGVKFIKLTRDLSYDDFCAYMADGRKEQEIRDQLRQWMPLSINAGEMRVQDAIRVSLSETLTEALERLDTAWTEVKKVGQQEAEAKNQQQEKLVGAQLQGKAAESDKKYNHDKLMKILDYLLKAGLMTQEAKNEYMKEAQLLERSGAMEAAGSMPVPA